MTNLEYPFEIKLLSQEDGGGYLIEFPDLPGCISDGDTIEEAIANGQDAMQEWLDACSELNRKIPAPTFVSEPRYSGKVLQRFPKTIHSRLVATAKREGVSLNQLILAFVAEGLGRKEA